MKVVRIKSYNICLHEDGSIIIAGGYDTYIGFSGTLEQAIELVKSWDE